MKFFSLTKLLMFSFLFKICCYSTGVRSDFKDRNVTIDIKDKSENETYTYDCVRESYIPRDDQIFSMKAGYLCSKVKFGLLNTIWTASGNERAKQIILNEFGGSKKSVEIIMTDGSSKNFYKIGLTPWKEFTPISYVVPESSNEGKDKSDSYYEQTNPIEDPNTFDKQKPTKEPSESDKVVEEPESSNPSKKSESKQNLKGSNKKSKKSSFSFNKLLDKNAIIVSSVVLLIFIGGILLGVYLKMRSKSTLPS